MELAELDADARKALNDSDFAYIDSKGGRHLPVHDKGHVHAALGRFKTQQFESSAAKRKAARKILSRAKSMGMEVADDSDVAQAVKMAEPLLVAGPRALIPRQPIKAGETVRLPFVQVGEWNFRDSYGPVEITDSDLDTIVGNWERGARRQDLALTAALNEEHTQLPEGVDPKTYVGAGAVGWITAMEREGDTVFADVELNRLGEQLIRDDRYRAVSPELLLNWIDPETDQAWGKTAAGLALTTMPRMKGLAKQGGALVERLAASEGRVLAFAEYAADVHVDKPLGGLSIAYAFPDRKRLPLHSPAAVQGARARFMTVAASEPERDEAWQRVRSAAAEHGVEVPDTWKKLAAAECARLLMAEDDSLAEEMTELPLCVFQPMPDGSCFGRCPGYTRNDDGDGDYDVCAMADKGCAGYIPCGPLATIHAPDWATQDALQSAYMAERHQSTEGGPMGEQTQTGTAGAGATATQQADTTQQTSGEVQAAEAKAADLAEMNRMLAAERNERLAMAEELRQAREQLQRMDAAEKLSAVDADLEALVGSGRITPAVREKLEERKAEFAEKPYLLDAFKELPENSAVPFGERGSGTEAERGKDESARLDAAAKTYMAEQGRAGNKLTYKQALLHVSRVGYRG